MVLIYKVYNYLEYWIKLRYLYFHPVSIIYFIFYICFKIWILDVILLLQFLYCSEYSLNVMTWNYVYLCLIRKACFYRSWAWQHSNVNLDEQTFREFLLQLRKHPFFVWILWNAPQCEMGERTAWWDIYKCLNNNFVFCLNDADNASNMLLLLLLLLLFNKYVCY